MMLKNKYFYTVSEIYLFCLWNISILYLFSYFSPYYISGLQLKFEMKVKHNVWITRHIQFPISNWPRCIEKFRNFFAGYPSCKNPCRRPLIDKGGKIEQKLRPAPRPLKNIQQGVCQWVKLFLSTDRESLEAW